MRTRTTALPPHAAATWTRWTPPNTTAQCRCCHPRPQEKKGSCPGTRRAHRNSKSRRRNEQVRVEILNFWYKISHCCNQDMGFGWFGVRFCFRKVFFYSRRTENFEIFSSFSYRKWKIWNKTSYFVLFFMKGANLKQF